MSKKQVLFASTALLALMAFFVLTPDAMAVATTSGLPIDTPLEKLRNFATGPLAMTMMVIGIVGAGFQWFRGGEFNSAIAGLGGIAIIGGVLMSVPTLLTGLFNNTAVLH